MKKSLKVISLFTLFFLIFLIPKSVYSKSYSYDFINTTLDFYPDGSVVVSQIRAYNFVGSFSYAFLDILKKGAEDVKFLEIKDLDNNLPLQFNLDEDASHVKATWYYSADNQVKKFLIMYRIDGAVKKYEDVAEFYWKVIEDNHERIDKFDSYINLPLPSPNLFKVFIHSSSTPGELKFSDDLKNAHVTMQNIPSNTFVEFRILTEPQIFSGVQQIPEKKYESILNEEKRIFYTIPFQYFNILIFLILLISPIIVFFYFYLKYGVEPKVDYQLKYEPEPPRDIPPMALAALYGSDLRTSARGLLATIFDLARRGYIDIREEKKEHLFGLYDTTEQIFKITKKGKDELSSKKSLHNFEDNVLDLLFVEMSNSKDEIKSSEMTKWCRVHQAEVKSAIPELNEDAKSWFEMKYFRLYEPKSLKKASKFPIILFIYGFLLFGFLSLIKAIPFDFHLLIFIQLFLLFVSFLAMNAIKRRTPEATLEIKKWNAFKKYISDFSAMKDAPTTLLQIWDRYLVYAVVLDVAKELLENIKNFSLERNSPVVAVAWYHPIGAPGIPSGMMSPESFSAFSSNMSNMINALNSSSSVGGGFSGGGGGGSSGAG